MTNDQKLTVKEQSILDDHSDTIEKFVKDLETTWKELASEIGCDVETAYKIVAHASHRTHPLR